MNTLLIAPNNLFQLIESTVTQNPELLKAHNWHELPNAREALVDDQIMDSDTAHCLAGWVVYFTPNAAKAERLRHDVDVFANEILVNSGRKPIPLAIYHSDEESMLKIIKRRAVQEQLGQLKFKQESN